MSTCEYIMKPGIKPHFARHGVTVFDQRPRIIQQNLRWQLAKP